MLESLFNIVEGPQACNFINKRLQHWCFPVKFATFLRTPTLKNICERLLHKSHQILNQTKRNINKLCLGKISLEKTLRIKFSVDSRFSNEFYGKKRKPGNARNQQKAF